MMDHTKPAQWFRMYAEFATDPKVQMMSEPDQRRYLMLLCLRCSNGNVTLHDNEVAFQLRINVDEWAKTKAELVTRKLVTNDNKPTAWEKRQKASDSSAERVAKHRALRKAASNADVTLPQRPVEKEIEKEKEKDKDKTLSAKPTKFDPVAIELPACLNREAWEAWIAYRRGRKITTKQDTMLAQVKALEGWAAEGHDPAQIIRESITNGWQGLFAPKGAAKPTPTKQSARDQYAADMRAAQAKYGINGENHAHDARDITGDCTVVA